MVKKMRKLLLLINSLLFCALLPFSQTNPSKNSEKKRFSLDSTNSNAKQKLQTDTLKRSSNTTKKGKSTNSSIISNKHQGERNSNTSNIKRIDHRSDNESKLDSIKYSKIKTKK